MGLEGEDACWLCHGMKHRVCGVVWSEAAKQLSRKTCNWPSVLCFPLHPIWGATYLCSQLCQKLTFSCGVSFAGLSCAVYVTVCIYVYTQCACLHSCVHFVCLSAFMCALCVCVWFTCVFCVCVCVSALMCILCVYACIHVCTLCVCLHSCVYFVCVSAFMCVFCVSAFICALCVCLHQCVHFVCLHSCV